MSMNSLEDRDLEGEKVLLRTDLNMPIEEGELQETIRFDQYIETIQELSEEGARILVVAHQGRPGRKDFKSLNQHAEMLSENLNTDVDLVKQFFTDNIRKEIQDIQNGEVKLLENVRFLSEELKNFKPKKHSDDYFVRNLAQHFDLYINDAFSAAHRSHASLVGFNNLLDDYPGPIMEQEIQNCRKVVEEFENGVLVLGGEKPADIVSMIEQKIEEVDNVLLGGIPAEAALIVEGHDLGEKEKWLKSQSINLQEDRLKELLNNYPEKIILPQDLKTDDRDHQIGEIPEDGMTWDIGEETIEKYKRIISQAENVLLKGPMGAFDEGNERGTKEIIDAIAENEAYTVLGGGHTSSLVKRFGHDIEDFDHVSIAGGAFVRFMSGEELAAIEALKN